MKARQKGRRAGLSLRSKLLLMLLGAGLSATALMSWIGYQHGEQQLTDAAFKQLTSLRSSKQQHVETYFNNLRAITRVLGTVPTISEAIEEFSQGFHQLDPKTTFEKDRKKTSVKTQEDLEDESLTTAIANLAPYMSDKEKKNLDHYYKKVYFPSLGDLLKGKENVEIFWPRTVPGRKVQSLYISENPNKQQEKGKLLSSGQDTPYDKVHKKYHSFLRTEVKQTHGFYDVFLIEAKTGMIVYSAKKEVDFGTSLLNGPYANTALGQLYHKLRESHSYGLVEISDYSFYPPSGNVPAAFIGTPVYSGDGVLLGMLIMQMPVEKLNDFMTNNREWKLDGLGDSGEVYIVGDDRLMRSDSRFLIEDKKVFLDGLKAAHINKKTIAAIDSLNTTVLLQWVNTDGVNEAFRGKSRTKIIKDYRGVSVLSSYAPLDIPGLRWVILAEIDEAEARVQQSEFARKVMLTAGSLLLGLTLFSLLLASKFLKPISVLVEGVKRIRSGEKHVKIPRLSSDEFGDLSDTFNNLTKEIDERDRTIEKQEESHDNLLKRMYPETIVERLKRGEASIVDTLHQVSVVYIIIHGFSKQTQSYDSTDSVSLLNEIIDAIDDVGRAAGVEKVKTLGEHYIGVCGLTVPRLDHARRAIEFAQSASTELALINARYKLSLALRIGIHSGPVHSGIVGSHEFTFDIWGNSLNIARRIVFEAGKNQMRITTHTYHQLNTSDDFGAEQIVHTKAAGDISTFERDLDITVDEKRVDERGKIDLKKRDVKTRSGGKVDPEAAPEIPARQLSDEEEQKNDPDFDVKQKKPEASS